MFGFTVCFGAGGTPKPIENREGLKTLYEFLGMYLSLEDKGITVPAIEASIPILPVNATRPRFVTNPPVGERIIDYSIRAGQRLGRPFTVRELVEVMLQLGWETIQTIPRQMNSTVYSTIRKSERFRQTDPSHWVLVPEDMINGN